MNSEQRELVNRKFELGTSITNCVIHMNRSITERPDDCKLCLTDLRNHMERAIKVNQWLNKWKDDAMRILSCTCPSDRVGCPEHGIAASNSRENEFFRKHNK